MKKSILSLIVLAVIVGLSSCDNSVLTASGAEDAIKKDIFWENPIETNDFKIGYFEIDTDNLLKYQQLKAAGMITFSIEKVIEKRQRSSYNWWTGTTYYTVNKNHYFIDVQLTEEGKKYVIDEEKNPKKGREDIIEDLNLDDPKLQEEEVVPDYMTNYEAVKIDNEEVAEGATEPEPEPLVTDASTDSAIEVTDSTSAPAEQPKQEKKAEKKKSDYEKALDKVNEIYVTVKLGKIEIVKCKEVYCPEEYVKLGKAECSVVYEFTEKTPFGYVLGAPRDGVRFQSPEKIHFTRYEDLGWVVVEND